MYCAVDIENQNSIHIHLSDLHKPNTHTHVKWSIRTCDGESVCVNVCNTCDQESMRKQNRTRYYMLMSSTAPAGSAVHTKQDKTHKSPRFHTNTPSTSENINKDAPLREIRPQTEMRDVRNI